MPPGGQYPPQQPWGQPQYGGQPPQGPPRRNRTPIVVGAIVAVVVLVAVIVGVVLATRDSGDDKSGNGAKATNSVEASGEDSTDTAEPSIGRTRLERTRTATPQTETSRSSTSRSSTQTTTRPTTTGGSTGADEQEIAAITEIVVESTTSDAIDLYCSSYQPAPGADEIVYEFVAIDDIEVAGDEATAHVTVDDVGELLEATLSYVKESSGWKYCP